MYGSAIDPRPPILVDIALGAGAGVLVGAALWLNPQSVPGAGLLFVSAIYLGAVLLARPLFGVGARQRRERATDDFLRRCLAARRPEDVGRELAACHRTAFASGASLVIPAVGGGIAAIGSERELEDELLDRALPRLAQRRATWRGEDPDVDRLADRLGADAVVPLAHGDMLLGVATLQMPRRSGAADYLEAIRVYGTIALANTFLDREARSRGRHRDLFDLAGQMQRSLLPGEDPVELGELRVAGRSVPMSECGGDLWAVASPTPGELAILVADATGHGAAAQLVAASAIGAFDALVATAGAGADPGALLGELDRHLAAIGRGGFEMTGFALVTDAHTGAVRYAAAGGPLPLLASGGEVRPIGPGGLEAAPLGSGGKWPSAEAALAPGDQLVLFTDGLPDAGTPVVAGFGAGRIAAAVRARGGEPVEALCAGLLTDVESFLAGQEPADDITVVALERRGGPR